MPSLFGPNPGLEEPTNARLGNASPEPQSAPPGAAAVFASLPAELRLLILANLPTLIDVRHALVALPDLRYAYMGNQKAVLTAVMKNAVRASHGNSNADQLWTRMWVGMAVDYVIAGMMNYEDAMGCVGGLGLGKTRF